MQVASNLDLLISGDAWFSLKDTVSVACEQPGQWPNPASRPMQLSNWAWCIKAALKAVH